MSPFISRAIAALVGVVLCATMSFSQKEKEVEFADFKLKFAVPTGWKVLKTEKKKDSAFIVLQENAIAKGAKSKSLVGIWMGKKYIADAPGGGDVKAGSDAAGAIWASRNALAWAAGTPNKLLPLQADSAIFGFSLGDKSTITAEYKTQTQSVYAVGSEKREGGELTAAAVADPAVIEKVKKMLDGFIGKEK